ncbi:MAG TPA: winged helix-turn-helix domain-containing protein [Candidatus Methanofastidiosa archaeon]|nr:winged helix-turn-helix domain-containing protein [Candidatus Methanofastidiosa archaeon]HPR41228.1 winged helix-turn-helix domain-containing protein [Candidatus Methanofastidiosa archaeon]
MNEGEIHDKLEKMDKKMDCLQEELRRYMESTDKKHYEVVLKATWDMMRERMLDSLMKNSDESLNRYIDNECPNRTKCIDYFRDLIERNIDIIDNAENEDMVSDIKKDLIMEIKDKAPYDKCETCATELSNIFDRHLRLISSLDVYSGAGQEDLDVSIGDLEGIVDEYLEPIANDRRMQIMLALSKRTMTFSEISRMTDLNGGNLLFHLQKLQCSGMIMQRHDRGDYMITEKGFSTLRALSALVRERNDS